MAVELYSSKSFSWPGLFAGLVQELRAKGVPKGELSDKALAALDSVIATVDKALPEGCWWAVGSSGVWGPEGTKLPDVEALLKKAFEDKRKEIREKE